MRVSGQRQAQTASPRGLQPRSLHRAPSATEGLEDPRNPAELDASHARAVELGRITEVRSRTSCNHRFGVISGPEVGRSEAPSRSRVKDRQPDPQQRTTELRRPVR